MNFQNNFSVFDSQLEQLNTIIMSTTELVSILNSGDKLNDNLRLTITEIFKFLYKVINLLPEVLLTKEENALDKSHLIESYKITFDSWEEFDEVPAEFIENWKNFARLWKDFYEHLQKINKSKKTIYLSLN